MTHFNVALITEHPDEDPEPYFAPYDENAEDDEFLEFEDRTQEVLDEWRNDSEKHIEYPDGSRKRLWSLPHGEQEKIEEGAKKGLWKIVDVPVKELYDSPSDYAESYHGYNAYEENGQVRFGYYTNPDGYWDYWVPMEEALVVNGEKVESCRCSEVEDGMRCSREKAEGMWEAFEKKNVDFMVALANAKSYEASETKEEFVAARTAFSTYAVITPDGEWHQPGRMGWFGMSGETGEDWNTWATSYRERFLEQYADCHIRLFDCHI